MKMKREATLARPAALAREAGLGSPKTIRIFVISVPCVGGCCNAHI
jgi:hypothetical protein